MSEETLCAECGEVYYCDCHPECGLCERDRCSSDCDVTAPVTLDCFEERCDHVARCTECDQEGCEDGDCCK